MSPEVLTRNQYDAKSDIWSLGCLLYEMASGNSPHAQATSLEGLQALVNAGDLRLLPSCYTKELFSLIKWMLTRKVTDCKLMHHSDAECHRSLLCDPQPRT